MGMQRTNGGIIAPDHVVRQQGPTVEQWQTYSANVWLFARDLEYRWQWSTRRVQDRLEQMNGMQAEIIALRNSLAQCRYATEQIVNSDEKWQEPVALEAFDRMRWLLGIAEPT